jgi:hypothetical protein
MILTRKSLWSALAAAALTVGCSSEESAPPAETPTTSPTTTPAPTPGRGGAPLSGSDELSPAPAPAKEAPAPEKKDEAAPPKVEAPKTEPAKEKADAPKSTAADVKLSDEEVAEVKKLPADEQPVALKQAVCPVSDEHLGSMGKPVKVTAEGQTFYLCCDSCMKKVKADAKSVVAKLPGK